jgi:hypothetical protein
MYCRFVDMWTWIDLGLNKGLGRVLTKGRERNPPPCSRHLGQVVYGCVTLWRQRVAQLPIPPPLLLLVSWEIADRLPNQTICPTRDC